MYVRIEISSVALQPFDGKPVNYRGTDVHESCSVVAGCIMYTHNFELRIHLTQCYPLPASPSTAAVGVTASKTTNSRDHTRDCQVESSRESVRLLLVTDANGYH